MRAVQDFRGKLSNDPMADMHKIKYLLKSKNFKGGAWFGFAQY